MTQTIDITGIGSDMQGVGRLADERAVFVPGALPGERVTVRITRDAGRFCEAELTKVLAPSAHRIAPNCPHDGACGGCRIRHAAYDHTLELKRMRVVDALTRIAGIESPAVRETIGCETPDRARNKAEYPIRNGVIGMFAAGGARLVPIEDCLLQSAQSVAIMRRAAELLKGSNVSGWLVTRTNAQGDGMAILSAQGKPPAWLDRLAEIPGVRSIWHCALKPRPTHALDGAMHHVCGERTIRETLCGLDFDISPQTFFQVNTAQAEILYERALDAAGLTDESRVLDAYCGCGTLTLAAAKYAQSALGVEIVAPAISDARKNAARNRLDHKTRFVCADAGAEIPHLVRAGEMFDRVIVDPPRKGCDPALIEALGLLKPERIAYVSCDPATLARDVKRLRAHGYGLAWAQPVDMFPWTGHVECVVLMSRERY
ncbi:MAG: 23S rRNA (uracil(1939)-C(5))-methyltransferase RlmD [Christensenellales bacterium]|jgi:23S rRNA (uracil1939-C5)-methyltransferase